MDGVSDMTLQHSRWEAAGDPRGERKRRPRRQSAPQRTCCTPFLMRCAASPVSGMSGQQSSPPFTLSLSFFTLAFSAPVFFSLLFF